MNNERTFNEDSSEEDTTNPLPAKKAATSSPASEKSGTRVPKGRGGGDLPKISAFPANTPNSRGRGSSQGDKFPARAPHFSTNTYNKTYTVASVYVPPSEAINELAFDIMINRFSSRYLILGDFNGHSHLWGANQENERGKVVEKLIDRHNLILLNDSVHTWFDTYHQSSSLLDLSLCHPFIYMDVEFEVYSDRLGSDHHPIIIIANTSDHPMPKRVQNGISRKPNGMHSKINVLLK